MWVDSPTPCSEAAGKSDATPPTFMAAGLTCEPVFLDWGGVGTVHVSDTVIVPGGVYDVQAVDFACGVSAEEFYSDALPISTSRWGDLTGDCSTSPCTPPDGRVDFVDIAAVVDKYRNLPSAPAKTRADVAPSVPDLKVDMVDVSQVLDAFRGNPYPFAVPTACQTAD